MQTPSYHHQRFPRNCQLEFERCRKNKATFHAVPPARVRPPSATRRPLVPTPGVGPPAPRGPPGAGLARACPQAPTPAAGTPCREPDGGRAASAAGAAQKGLRLGHGLFHRRRTPTLSPPRHRPRSPPAHQRPVAAALRSQRWPPDGGGWPCAAWVMGRRRRWGCGEARAAYTPDAVWKEANAGSPACAARRTTASPGAPRSRG